MHIVSGRQVKPVLTPYNCNCHLLKSFEISLTQIRTNKMEIVHALKIVVYSLKFLLLGLCVKRMYSQFYLNKLDNPCILTPWCLRHLITLC